MSKSIKAALLSALVFPGVGQLYLKRYAMATALLCVSFAALYVLLSQSIAIAIKLTDKIQMSGITPNAAAISELMSQSPAALGSQQIDIATFVLTFCWVAGIVHGYRAGRTQVAGPATSRGH